MHTMFFAALLAVIGISPAFGLSENPSRQEIIDHYEHVVVKVERSEIGEKKSWSGTGFFVSPTLILTNAHVAGELPESADRLRDIYSDADVARAVFWIVFQGKRYKARFMGRDPDIDLARLEVRNEIPSVSVATLGNSDDAKVGDQVLVFGNALGMETSVTGGIISGKHRIVKLVSYEDYLQTDAAINPGNSGGPLVSLKSGKVIGVVNSHVPTADNMGFAIPINLYQETASALTRTVKHSWIGIEFPLESLKDSEGFQGLRALNELTGINDIATLEKVRSEVFKDGGVLITDVMRGELAYYDPTAADAFAAGHGEHVQPPASKAGLAIGDVVKKFGPYTIKKSRDLLYAIFKSKPYESITVNIVRFDDEGKRTEKSFDIVPILRNPDGVDAGFH